MRDSMYKIDENIDLDNCLDSYFGLHNKTRWNTFKDKKVVITGAGTGYGQALAVALLVAGAEVYLIGRRYEKLLETTKISDALIGVTCHHKCIKCDLTDVHQVDSVVSEIKSFTHNIDILINCAGVPASNNASLLNATPIRWDEMFNINLKAQWLVSKRLFELMQNSKIARILFFTSGAGWADTDGFGLYNISKAAVNSLSMSMAKEYQSKFPDKVISINCINPGEAKTEMNASSSISAYSICSMVLTLLSTEKNIPNGHFFHRDGRHLRFCDAREYPYTLE